MAGSEYFQADFMELLIVTGMSGAGKSTAINVLEDLGYYCIDNLPYELIITFSELTASSNAISDKVAIVTDVRSGGSAEKLLNELSVLTRNGIEFKMLFLDASNEVLIRRYKETRRKHPLYENYNNSIEESVLAERELMLPLKEHADVIIDTSLITIAQLKERIVNLTATSGSKIGMHIHCMSFGFKYGIPLEADLVFDVRCLPNPFYILELKNKTGLEKEVKDYVMKWEQSRTLSYKLFNFIDYLVPLYKNEGKSQLVIAIGCTGGKHRSVVFAELLHDHFEQADMSSSVQHRDISK